MAEFEDCWKDDDKGGQSRGCVVMQMTIFDHHLTFCHHYQDNPGHITPVPTHIMSRFSRAGNGA